MRELPPNNSMQRTALRAAADAERSAGKGGDLILEVQMRSGRVFLLIGSILMLLLGSARGVGGVFLLLQGRAADPAILASPSVVTNLALGLVVVGLTEIVAALGLLRGKHGFWVLGVVGAVLFVIDGAINGYYFYGAPGDRGTAVNIVVATLIVGSLVMGRKALPRHSSDLAGSP